MTERIFKLNILTPRILQGVNDENLSLIRKKFPALSIVARGENLKIKGSKKDLDEFTIIFHSLEKFTTEGGELTDKIIGDAFESEAFEEEKPLPDGNLSNETILFGNNGKAIKARTKNQQVMVQKISTHDIVFAIGPAGTGKTYTAVAVAVRMLKDKEIKRIILTRPAVEAGENLGFLPGDLKEKIDPYLRPLYDALGDMIPADKLQKYLDTNIIEIVPLAFMRGRTLDNCTVILDEAQNTTEMQLKMFLTRMGPSAKMIVNGDLTQIDLPSRQKSGLKSALFILKEIKGIAFVQLTQLDVVRHKLVKSIIRAYDKQVNV